MNALFLLLYTLGLTASAEPSAVLAHAGRRFNLGRLTAGQMAELQAALRAAAAEVDGQDSRHPNVVRLFSELVDALVDENTVRILAGDSDHLDCTCGASDDEECTCAHGTVDTTAADVDEPAVAAAGRVPASPRRVSLTQLAAQRRSPAHTPNPADHTPAAGDHDQGVRAAPSLVASSGERAGQDLTMLEAAEQFQVAAQRVAGMPFSGRQFVARRHTAYPTGRVLDRTDPEGTQRRVAAVVASMLESEEGPALVAAGGLCVPLTSRYEQDVDGDDSRPVRDALASFQVRGGVRFMPPPSIVDVVTEGADAAIGVWTDDDDIAALNGEPTKAIQRIECGNEIEVVTYALTKRFLVGNALTITYPDKGSRRWSAWPWWRTPARPMAGSSTGSRPCPWRRRRISRSSGRPVTSPRRGSRLRGPSGTGTG